MDETHGRCLIALTTFRFSPGFGAAALQSARERGEAVLLCLVRERAKSDAVADRLADSGFLAERMLHELRDTMAEEYRTRGREHLEELAEEARRNGVPVEVVELEGAFPDVVARVAQERSVTRVLVTRLERPSFARVLFGSELDRLIKSAPCPVEVFDRSGELLGAGRS